jgi:putative flippase GtrA
MTSSESLAKNKPFVIEFLRFAAVSGICAGIDLGIGLVALVMLGESLYFSSSIGWCGGLASGYLMHSYWTFKNRNHSASWLNFAAFVGNGLLILTVRYLIIALSGAFNIYAELTLALAILGSFIINFVISKAFIFK